MRALVRFSSPVRAAALAATLISTLAFGAQAQTSEAAEHDTSSIVVLSHWTVRLPFEPSETDPLTIGKVTEPMWGWMREGQRLISVNGMEVGHLNAVRAVLRISTKLTEQTQLPVKLGVGKNASGELIEELVIVPIVQDTVLKNGMRFETVFDGSRWVSTLTMIPTTADTDLQVGDKLVSMGDAQFDKRDSAQMLFQSERRKGMMDYLVNYSRNGDIRTGRISLDPVSRAPAAPQLAEADNDMSKVEIMSHWSVRLPFEPTQAAPKTIGRVVANSSIQSGDQVMSINGMEVPHLNAIPAMLRLSTEPDEMTVINVDVEIMKAGTETYTHRNLSLPITQDTVLANGLRFETIYTGERWATTLVSMPSTVNTDLLPGDKILGHGDGKPFNMRTSLKDTIRDERRKGKSDFSVIVARSGKLMLCKFSY